MWNSVLLFSPFKTLPSIWLDVSTSPSSKPPEKCPCFQFFQNLKGTCPSSWNPKMTCPLNQKSASWNHDLDKFQTARVEHVTFNVSTPTQKNPWTNIFFKTEVHVLVRVDFDWWSSDDPGESMRWTMSMLTVNYQISTTTQPLMDSWLSVTRVSRGLFC